MEGQQRPIKPVLQRKTGTFSSESLKNIRVTIGQFGPFLNSVTNLPFLWSSVVIKVGMVGDSAIGKTSLMVKYVEGAFDEDYIQTLG